MSLQIQMGTSNSLVKTNKMLGITSSYVPTRTAFALGAGGGGGSSKVLSRFMLRKPELSARSNI